MKLADLERFRNRGLCSGGLDAAYTLLGAQAEYATPRAMAEAYIAAGGDCADVLRVALLIAPDSASRIAAAMWPLARVSFGRLPAPLSAYAETLGPENWVAACEAACLARDSAATTAECGAYDRAVDAAESAATANAHDRIQGAVRAVRAYARFGRGLTDGEAVLSRAAGATARDEADFIGVTNAFDRAVEVQHIDDFHRVVAIVLDAVEAL